MNGGQSRKGSVVESITNIIIGFSVNWTANILILPLFGFTTETGWIAFKIGCVFTVISFCRSYILRRVYNWLYNHGIFRERTDVNTPH